MNNWTFCNKESRKQLKDFMVGRSLGDDMVQLPHFSGGETEIQRGKGTGIIQGRIGTRIMSPGSLLIALCVYQ